MSDARAQIVALMGALRGLTERFNGLLRCPDCEAALGEGVHAEQCPVGRALVVLAEMEGGPATAIGAWVEALFRVADVATTFLGTQFEPGIIPSVVVCMRCGRVSERGAHTDTCVIRELHEAVNVFAGMGQPDART